MKTPPAPGPPRWIERLLERTLPAGLSGQGTLGDLSEEFERRVASAPARARLWYLRQATSLLLYRILSPGGPDAPPGRSGFVMDVRWSVRTVLRHPAFSAGVVLVLGLGLGTNLAVFSVVDGTLENTNWWTEPDRTVAIWPEKTFSFGQLDLYRQEQATYRSLGGYVEMAFSLRTAAGESQSVKGVRITPELFRELAAQPALGRPLADDDALLGVEPVVVLGDGLWRREFGADPGVLGRRLEVGGTLATVVGVQARGAAAPGGRVELWIPLVMDPRDDDFWKAQNLHWVGVLRDGADHDAAHADLMGFTDLLSTLFPMFYPRGFADGAASITRADASHRRLVATPLLLLFAGTGLLLLMTALNVGSLLLGRAIDRREELAVRASLGAGRGRIARQLLVEGGVLTALALGLALATAAVGGGWIAGLFVDATVVANSSVLSPSVLLFAAGAAALAWTVLNGVPIAYFWRSHRSGLQVRPESGASLQRGLVAAQAALATLLLVSATLLVATVDNLRDVPLGFDPRGLVSVELSPPEDRVGSPGAARDLYARLVDRTRGLPGVSAVGLTGWLPLRAQAPTTPINLRSNPVDPREALQAPMHKVDAGFFEVLGVTPRDGRLLGPEDEGLVPTAIVVNETLAQALWPDGSAVGQLIAIDPHAWDSWAPVVGVIPDIRSGDMRAPVGPALYVSLRESPARDLTLVVRATDPTSLGPSLRGAVREVDPLVPVRSVATMDEVVRTAYATSWVVMGLLMVLAGLATGLGTLGIYAVLAQHVSANRHAIGVRLALGASPGHVVATVVRSGLALVAVGIGVGSLAALFSNQLLESLLFEVSAAAPLAFVVPAVALALISALAAWIPAARAGRLPPAHVLRSD